VASATSERFTRKVRIVRSSDFQLLYKSGIRVNSRRFVLFGRENEVGCHRLGITVSKRVGNAVVRNRIKRIFREIFRKSRNDMPGQLDLVVNAKAGWAGAGYWDLREEFLAAARKICR